jgi:hypothetical protein
MSNLKKVLLVFIIGFVLVWLVFFSKRYAYFEITNGTNKNIVALSIQPDIDTNKIDIVPNKTVKFKTNMSGKGNTDGSYVLRFKLNDSIRVLNFGYYSNGTPAERITKIDIRMDTIIIQPEYGRGLFY